MRLTTRTQSFLTRSTESEFSHSFPGGFGFRYCSLLLPMFRPSSRDLSLVGSLLPLFTREITADPEQHDRARREARIRGLKQMGNYLMEARSQAERREDAELRARLAGASKPFGSFIITDSHRRGSCRPIASTLRSSRAVDITDCTQVNSHSQIFWSSNFSRDSQRRGTHTEACTHRRSKSVDLTV